ncbi:HutD protein [Aquimarina sp. MAR_2010_214]|uniref:HutD/Ves family protein n=1 Tax=Aquimarina sp. MAR_2010_214 TaxID=1250026 RepID=UPI000CB7697A|nr:HutD family protein [Aquimarina sp. MAR_2010_214]PKV50938.1 HutD protein [Aquimarina sp. MAR_2010_214]
MEVTIITSDTFKTNTWSGGTTTQFFMYPPTANYKELNFDFRLSMATVAIEKSVFTSLPGVSRTLLVLDGEITLQHEDRYTKQLSKLDSDTFEGGWKTSSIGMCTDFNLMTTGNTVGKLGVFTPKQNENILCPIKNKWDWVFIYNYSGEVTIDINHQEYTIHQSDVLVIRQPIATNMHINAIKDSTLVFSEIVTN